MSPTSRARGVMIAAIALIATQPRASRGQDGGAATEHPSETPRVSASSALVLTAGTSRFTATLKVQGQTYSIQLETLVRDAGDVWAVQETWWYEPPLVQTSELEKGSLNLRRCAHRNGPHGFGYEVRDGRITGRTGNEAFGPFKAQWQPIAVDAGGPLFADVAGFPQAVAALPLEEGYSRSFLHCDLGRRPPIVRKTLTVVGREAVEFRSGARAAWRVQVNAHDPDFDVMTLWVAVDSRQVLRVDTPSLSGGAAATIVLRVP